MKEELKILIDNVEQMEEGSLKFNEVIRILGIIDTFNEEAYQEYYLKGCLWRLLPSSVNRDKEIEENLKSSIELKNDYIFSKTELSFFYFDKECYENVIYLLSEIDFSFFENRNQIWKSLKLEEIFLASKLYLTDLLDEKLFHDFESLISIYLFLPEDEVSVPNELVNSVLNNREKDNMKKLIKITYGFINSDKMKNYFNKEIKLKFSKFI